MKWIIKCFKQYADFRRRARRREYWWFTLINFIVMFVLMMCFMTPVMTSMLSDPEFMEAAASADFDAQAYAADIESHIYNQLTHSTAFYIYIVYMLIVLIPSLSVTVRRLHDTGRSGWWCLLPIGASVLQNALKVAGLSAAVSLLASLAALAVSIVFIVWMFMDSQLGENKWGPNPKEQDWNEDGWNEGDNKPLA